MYKQGITYKICTNRKLQQIKIPSSEEIFAYNKALLFNENEFIGLYDLIENEGFKFCQIKNEMIDIDRDNYYLMLY